MSTSMNDSVYNTGKSGIKKNKNDVNSTHFRTSKGSVTTAKMNHLEQEDIQQANQSVANDSLPQVLNYGLQARSFETAKIQNKNGALSSVVTRKFDHTRK